jgi:hypothetical protein
VVVGGVVRYRVVRVEVVSFENGPPREVLFPLSPRMRSFETAERWLYRFLDGKSFIVDDSSLIIWEEP